MSERRLGIFEMPERHVKFEPEMVAKVLKELEFVPTYVQCLWHKGCFEYIGLSPKFKALKEGEAAPRYKIEINSEGKAEAIEDTDLAT